MMRAISNLLIIANTMDESTESILQAIIPLSYDTPSDAFSHMEGNISNLTDLKKQRAAV